MGVKLSYRLISVVNLENNLNIITRSTYMPTLDTLIPESAKQIVNPISELISRRIIRSLGLTELFKGNLFIYTTGNDSSKFKDSSGNVRVSKNRCDVTVEPNYNPNDTIFDTFTTKDKDIHMGSNRGLFGETPILRDKRPNVYLYEVSVPCSVELKFKMKLKSVELADLVSTSIYAKAMSSSTIYNYNDVEYNYPLADRLIMMLYKVYKLQDDLTMTFQEYLKIASGDAIRILVNRHQLDSGNKELVIYREMTNVLGVLDYSADPPDEDERNNKVVDRYSVEFNYKFQFSKPSLLRLKFPIMINNQLFGSSLIKKAYTHNDPDKVRTHPNSVINEFFMSKNQVVSLKKAYPLTRYPDYDDWNHTPAMHHRYANQYQSVFKGILAVEVDPNDATLSLGVDIPNDIYPLLPTELANAIDELTTLEDKINVLKRESIFNIAIFSNDNLMTYDNINITDDLVLSVIDRISITKVYRIVISLVVDITILDAKYIYYMLNNPDYYVSYLEYFAQYLERHGYITITNNSITGDEQLYLPATYQQGPTLGARHGYGRSIVLNNITINTSR
jgi:hypothetical protein